MPHRPPLRSPQSRGGPYTTAPPTPTPSRAAEQHCLRLLERAATPASLLQPLAFLLKRGLHSNPLVLTRLFAAAGSAAPALLEPLVAALLRPGLPLDAFLLNTLIRAHVASPLPSARRRAAAFFPLMLRRGVVPNKFTFPFLLKSCAATPGSPATGLQAHAAALKFGFAMDHYVSNTLIHMYCCFGAGFLGDARNVFDRTPKDSAVTWSAMIGGYVRGGLSSDAVVLFREMQASGVRPDEVTVLGVLSAAADLGALELTRWVEKFVEREGIGRSVTLCNALIDTLAKCGDVDGAVAVFEGMEERTVVSWTSVIDALAMEGRGREAAAVFEEMKAVGVPPDDVAFIGVLTACSHAGMVDEGRGYFDSMKTEHGDESHPQYKEIYRMVEEMSRELRRIGHIAATSEVLLDLDEEDKEGALQWHSEKLAIAFVLLRTPPGTQESFPSLQGWFLLVQGFLVIAIVFHQPSHSPLLLHSCSSCHIIIHFRDYMGNVKNQGLLFAPYMATYSRLKYSRSRIISPFVYRNHIAPPLRISELVLIAREECHRGGAGESCHAGPHISRERQSDTTSTMLVIVVPILMRSSSSSGSFSSVAICWSKFSSLSVTTATTAVAMPWLAPKQGM
ncbi:hypothetical protein ZWY2020_018732 [Hordeum vulgare]|nr:hypothetical protein ZWY2020_018732 [Hordeum vulgare]